MVHLLSRFGHCISDEKVPRIDVCVDSFLTSSDSLDPNQTIKTLELYATLTWENFDVNLETLTETDSVHPTFGSYTLQVPQKINETI